MGGGGPAVNRSRHIESDQEDKGDLPGPIMGGPAIIPGGIPGGIGPIGPIGPIGGIGPIPGLIPPGPIPGPIPPGPIGLMGGPPRL